MTSFRPMLSVKNRFTPTLLAAALMGLVGCQSLSQNPTASAAKTADKPAARQALNSAVAAHNTGARERDLFIAQHDLNQDGQVTLEEYKHFRSLRFNEGDSGSKGYLTQDDYVDEYAARLDQQLEDERKAHIKQTKARFESLDSNKDGFISREEFNASGERMLKHLDKNGTGVIRDSGETPANAGPRSQLAMPTSHSAKGFVELYDTDGDGQVNRAEFDKERAAAFAASDSNSDGRLSFDEYQEEYLGRLDRKAESVRQAQLKQAVVRFKVIDTNKDERIDQDEYWAVGQRSFAVWDTNGDGVVSAQDPLPEPRRPRVPDSTKSTNSNSTNNAR